MFRPVWIVKREIIQKLEVDPKAVFKCWDNPFIRENLLKEGFKKEEDFFVAYKTFSDDLVFIGKEREVNKQSSTNRGADEQSQSPA